MQCTRVLPLISATAHVCPDAQVQGQTYTFENPAHTAQPFVFDHTLNDEDESRQDVGRPTGRASIPIQCTFAPIRIEPSSTEISSVFLLPCPDKIMAEQTAIKPLSAATPAFTMSDTRVADETLRDGRLVRTGVTDEQLETEPQSMLYRWLHVSNGGSSRSSHIDIDLREFCDENNDVTVFWGQDVNCYPEPEHIFPPSLESNGEIPWSLPHKDTDGPSHAAASLFGLVETRHLKLDQSVQPSGRGRICTVIPFKIILQYYSYNPLRLARFDDCLRLRFHAKREGRIACSAVYEFEGLALSGRNIESVSCMVWLDRSWNVRSTRTSTIGRHQNSRRVAYLVATKTTTLYTSDCGSTKASCLSLLPPTGRWPIAPESQWSMHRASCPEAPTCTPLIRYTRARSPTGVLTASPCVCRLRSSGAWHAIAARGSR